MTPAFKEHPQFCERVLQHTESLRNEPNLLDALAAALKEHGMPLPAAVVAASTSASTNASPVTPSVAAAAPSIGTAAASVAEQAVKALPAASAVPGAAPDKGPPPGLQRRRTEPTPADVAPSTPAPVNSGEHEASTPHAELFLLAKERKEAAKALWLNVRISLVHSWLCVT